MRQSEIKVGASYTRLAKDGSARRPRQVAAIFNGTVLYRVKLDQSRLVQRGISYTYETYDHANCSLKAFARWAEWESEAASDDKYDRLTFLDRCRKVATKLGKAHPEMGQEECRHLWHAATSTGRNHFSDKSGRVYCDDVIAIVTTTENGCMLVEKLENNNPVIYVDNTGDSYRYHGEYIHLVDHVDSLLEG